MTVYDRTSGNNARKGIDMNTLEQEREEMVKKLVDQFLNADGRKDFSEVEKVEWDALSEIAEEIFTLDIEIQENQ